MRTQTPWESVRNADGSAITIRFDWYDDHSAWRLDDLTESISTARELLARAGSEHAQIEHLHELPALVRALRALHRDEGVDDASVRKAMALADELDLGDDCESLDAQFEYESTLEHVNELLSAWQQQRTWVYTTDTWDVDVVRAFDRCKDRRDGLGERWSITFTDDSVELPDGTEVRAVLADDEVVALFDEVTYDDYWEEQFPAIAELLLSLNAQERKRARSLTVALRSRLTLRSEADEARALCELARRHDDRVIAKLCETVTGLADGWTGSICDLLNAAEALECVPL